MSMPMATGVSERSSLLGTLIGACVTLIVGLAVRGLPFVRVTAAAKWCSARAIRAASERQISRAFGWIDSGSRLIPFRVACLERSLAALLLLSFSRCGVIWCMGVRGLPFTSHAWISDLDGRPLGEAESVTDYRIMLEISPLIELDRRST
ncbi:lasso peptide biosynthesis B2 protein [Lentzea guizhouensis]|uniref:lasso peptide biosynthesis B2 protein n=1 Tax=Lentzea guizhouensis TaxID=1586287 RepID=UPI0008FF1727